MIRKLAQSIKGFWKPSILTLLFIVCEVVIEVYIPFVTADMVTAVKRGAAMEDIVSTGVLLVVMACLSLACGAIAAITCSNASAGFARNLRSNIFHKIQTYSFENIDKYSSSSLVTRLTTDVANVQMSYMMLIRTAIRSPLMLLFSIIMAYRMGGFLATAFVIVVPFLAFGIYLIAK